MYTNPLSTLISSCSLNHHLYADDTLDRISSWMTANLLTLNSSKTEFLLIGFSKQNQIQNQQLLTSHHSLCSKPRLHIWWTPHFFLTRSDLSPNLAITIFVSFAVSVHTSIPKQHPPSPLPLATPSLTIATLFITTCPLKKILKSVNIWHNYGRFFGSPCRPIIFNTTSISFLIYWYILSKFTSIRNNTCCERQIK